MAHSADLYPIFVSSRNALELRLSVSVFDAFNIARSNNYLGTGIAISSNRNGIWAQILAELGIVGVLLYLGFLLNLLRDLYTIGRAPPIASRR
jgi:O-antigen ligase